MASFRKQRKKSIQCEPWFSRKIEARRDEIKRSLFFLPKNQLGVIRETNRGTRRKDSSALTASRMLRAAVVAVARGRGFVAASAWGRRAPQGCAGRRRDPASRILQSAATLGWGCRRRRDGDNCDVLLFFFPCQVDKDAPLGKNGWIGASQHLFWASNKSNVQSRANWSVKSFQNH